MGRIVNIHAPPDALASPRRPTTAIEWAGMVLLAIASAALVGWWANLPWLTSWGAGWPAMKPVTAVCLLGLGLILARATLGSPMARQVAYGLLACTGLSLLQDIAGLDLGIERWLVPRGAAPGPGAESLRMAPATGIALSCAAAAIAMPDSPTWRRLQITAVTVIAAIGGMSLFDYVAGLQTSHRPFLFRSLSFPATVALLVVSGTMYVRIGTGLRVSRPRPLAQLLLALGVSIAGPLLLLGVYVGFRLYDAQSVEVRNQLLRDARTLSAAVDREIIGEIETMQGLANSPSLVQGDLANFQRQAEAVLTLRNIGAVLLLDLSGQQLVNTRLLYGSRLPRSSDLELLRRVTSDGKPAVGNLFTGAVSQTLQYNIAVPVSIGGQLRYILLRAPDPRAISSVVAGQPLPDGWLADVSDANDRVIARSRGNDTYLGKLLSDETRSRSKGRSGVIETVDLEGKGAVQAFVLSDFSGWRSSVWAPKAVLDGRLHALWRAILTSVLFALGLVAALGLGLARVIAGSIRQTENIVSAVAAGAPLPLTITPVAEANALARALVDADQRRAKAEGLQSQLRALIEHSTDFVALADLQGRLTYLNGAGRRMIGVAANADIAALQVTDYVTPASRELFRTTVIPTTREKGLWEGEMQLVNLATSAVIDVHRTSLAMRDEAGKLTHYATVTRNITARKQSEEATGRLAAIVTSSVDAILSKKLDSTVTTWNESATRMFGYTAEEMMGQSIRRLIPSGLQTEEDHFLASLSTGKQIENHETIRLHKDGHPIEVSISISPIRNQAGDIIGASKICRDITERKRAAAALVKSEQRLAAQKDALEMAVSGASIDSVLQLLVRAVATQLGNEARVALMIVDTNKQRLRVGATEGLSIAFTRDVDGFVIAPTSAAYSGEAVIVGDVAADARWAPYRALAEQHQIRACWSYPIRSFQGRVLGTLAVYHAVPCEPKPGDDGVIELLARTSALILERHRTAEERNQREEQVLLLMKEVNHRSKNMLSLVQAIARQTLAANPQDFLARFSERIQALSANQDLLVKNEWKGIDVEALVRTQLAHFADLIGTRVAMAGPTLRLTSGAAQAIGLALHELATNAGKYGALSNAAGRVAIGWRLDGDNFVISWSERDGPPVAAPDRRGFGTTVIGSMAKMSVDGTVDYGFAPTGITWQLTCPSANALDASLGDETMSIWPSLQHGSSA